MSECSVCKMHERRSLTLRNRRFRLLAQRAEATARNKSRLAKSIDKEYQQACADLAAEYAEFDAHIDAVHQLPLPF